MKLTNAVQIGISLLILTDGCDLCMGMPLQPDMAPPCQKGQKTRRHRRMFSPEEDQLLGELVKENGTENWAVIAEQMPTNVSVRQVKERWENYINCNPKPTFTKSEDLFITNKVKEMGNKWAFMAQLVSKVFGERFSPAAVKNRWHLLRRVRREAARNQRQLVAGIVTPTPTDPASHKMLEELPSEQSLPLEEPLPLEEWLPPEGCPPSDDDDPFRGLWY